MLRRSIVILLGTLGFAARAAAQADDRAQVLAAITDFMKGMRTRDTALMASRLDTLTRFTLVRPGPGGARVMVLRGTDFLRFVSDPNQPPVDEPIRNVVVHVDGDVASVWAEYQVRSNGTVSHCGYDAFHLARLGGKWKILNVSDSFRQEGCGAAW